MKAVVVRSKADGDIDRALAYYAAELPDRRDALLAAFERTFLRIGRNPGAGTPRYAHQLGITGLRAVPTPRFPFLVFYFEVPKEIWVLRVLHQKRELPRLVMEE